MTAALLETQRPKDLVDAMPLASAHEVAQHGTEIHACFLIARDSQSNHREIQQQECCDQLDFILHRLTMIGPSVDREQGVQPMTFRQNSKSATGSRSR